MATSSVKLTWEGDQYTEAVRRQLKLAVDRSAERVRTTTMRDFLNTPGQYRSGLAKFNTVGGKMSNAERINKLYSKGMTQIEGLKLIGLGKNNRTVASGGTVTVKDKKTGAVNTFNRVYWYGEPINKWTTASNPGSPPHKQTGNLQRSIQYQMALNGLSAKIGPVDQLKYARRMELGGKKLPARPYLKPAFDKCLPQILQWIQSAIVQVKP